MSESRSSEYSGKVVLITGGSRGLGREMALGFAAAGAEVIISSRNAESCAATAAEIESETGQSAISLPCHVGKWEQISKLVDAVYQEVERVDVLVNNAGASPLYPSLVDVSEELFDKTIALNLKGPFRLCALIGEQMVKSGGGAIINISSVAAIRPKPTDLIYACAKAGLDTLTIGLAKAFAPTVRVNSIMAGPFLTDIAGHWDMSVVGPRIATYPLARAGDPHEIVGAALYLGGPSASFTTGTVLRVDGGMGIA
ncbi:MAG: SDR family NAD(P)-dependent oxidoreductase [Acidimicrobiales bacterium]